MKKTALDQFDNVRATGIIAIASKTATQVIDVRITDGNQQIVLSTREGQAIRFNEEEVRPMGRATAGVTGMELESDRSRRARRSRWSATRWSRWRRCATTRLC